MREKRVWRYYCDFCKKAGCGKAAMLKHERHCCRNPQRACRMCKDGVEFVQPEMQTMLAAVAAGGLDELQRVTMCPACILAALIQDRMANPIVNLGVKGEYIPSREYIEYDYKAAAKSWWAEVEAQRQEEATWL